MGEREEKVEEEKKVQEQEGEETKDQKSVIYT